ncbi:hypothetical protein BWP24_10360 [Vibrio campbellii]|nr:hypothetical protein BWP24_10360 [Vibrio campbellii]ARR06732.1 unknow [Vibrio campbellii]
MLTKMELNWERLAQRIKEHWFELVCIRQALAPMSIDLMVQMTANEANLENMNINPSSMTIITTHANCVYDFQYNFKTCNFLLHDFISALCF